MRNQQLVTMANEIAAFFHGTADEQQGAESVASHLRRFWDPRMRKDIVTYLESGGEGLSPLARAGVEKLAINTKP